MVRRQISAPFPCPYQEKPETRGSRGVQFVPIASSEMSHTELLTRSLREPPGGCAGGPPTARSGVPCPTNPGILELPSSLA